MQTVIPSIQEEPHRGGGLDSDKDSEAGSSYCFIVNQQLHCIPLHDISNSPNLTIPPPEQDQKSPLVTPTVAGRSSHQVDVADFTPNKLYLKNRNLLYSLNNPSSVSDLENENNSNSGNTTNSSTIIVTPELSIPSTASSTSSRSPSPAEIDSQSISSSAALYLPKLIIDLEDNLKNDFLQLKHLLVKIFPSWSCEFISVKQLTGGITNMLVSCQYKSSEPILVRVYGQGTNLIIDRHREFISHLMLNSIGLAPPVYARFKNGLVYGYLSGRSLEPVELGQDWVYPLIGQQLGNLHRTLDYRLIDQGVQKIRTLRKRRKSSIASSDGKKRYIGNIWQLLEEWIDIVPINPLLIESFNSHLENEVTVDNLKQVIQGELNWMKNHLENSGSPIVASHCDLLSGNIIVPEQNNTCKTSTLSVIEENPIKFIDYEYMLPAPRGFDIANHFAEWQGFNCDRSAIPVPSITNPTMTAWVRAYLDDSQATDEQIKSLIDEIKLFYGMPGFYWGIWGMIQSELSLIEFDYAEYASLRLGEYWDWKSEFTNTER
ncbi:Ethanolamine kinase 1 [Spathaspora sp. JA1]|nr:Ethanolamine kinase 1 [Spathaspora sp. JA1]